ncbi:MAG: sugar transferase [Bacteroidia bacterium]|nr:sugar transferase [Bacteroidia bacterium]
MYKSVIKPILDWIIAMFAFVILSPILFIIAVAIKIDSQGSVFFLQNRLGKNGKVFKVIKFRSMRSDSNYKTRNTMESDPRITKVGQFIRKTSLDEIPQIINILKGEMSFIGPRPPVVNYPKKYEDYTDFERQRFLVKPGISGLAAIRCREVHDWNINIPIDIEYVTNLSFKLDLKLFIASLITFFKTDNIYTISNNP